MARQTESDIADVLVGALPPAEALPWPVLVANDASGRIAAHLHSISSQPIPWQRRAAGTGAPQPWPPLGPYAAAIVRLPKARAEREMTLHAVASVVAPDAPIWLYGTNDEGIKGAARPFAQMLGPVTTVDRRRHCRVLAARRPAAIVGLKSRLSDWRETLQLDVGAGPRPFTTYPGVFAHGRLDAGTALLLAHLPPIVAGARVLDYGCGMGVIAAAALARQPAARVTLIDADAVAIGAARENLAGLPNTALVCGAALGALGTATFDHILSNPPIHDGKAEDHGALSALVGDAPRHLVRGGRLTIVAQRRVHAARFIEPAFGACTRLAQDSVFEVLTAVRA